MVLTKEQEAELIKKYDKLIWHTVHRFKRKLVSHWDNESDLYQECAIVLLEHFRKAEDEEAVKRIPIADMINAMCRFNLGEQVVTVPKRTTDFSKKIHSIEAPVEWGSLEMDISLATMPMEDADRKIAFDAFVGSLPIRDRMVVDMKLSGCSNREAARSLGMTDVQITRSLHRSRDAYHRYMN